MCTINLSIPSGLHDPVVHIWTPGDAYEDVVRVSAAKCLKVNKEGTICIDLYHTQTNEELRPCLVHVGCATVFGDKADMVEESTHATIGSVRVQRKNLVKTAGSAKAFETGASLQCFIDPRSRTALKECAFMSRVRVPYYQARMCKLPAAAFYMRGPVKLTDAYVKKCVESMYHRCGAWNSNSGSSLQDLPVTSKAEKVLSIITEQLQSYPYIPDTDSRGRVCDSLTSVLVTKSGDCEDFARASVELFSGFAKFFEANKGDYPVENEVFSKYTCNGLLCTVASERYENGKSGERTDMAHLVAVAMPKTHNCKPIVLESTGIVEPFSIYTKETCQAFDALQNNVPRSLRVKARGPQLGFYQRAVTLFAGDGSVVHLLNSKGEVGCDFKSFLSGNAKRVAQNPELTKEAKATIQKHLALEHPLPEMQACHFDAPREYFKNEIVNVQNGKYLDAYFENSKARSALKDVERVAQMSCVASHMVVKATDNMSYARFILK